MVQPTVSMAGRYYGLVSGGNIQMISLFVNTH